MAKASIYRENRAFKIRSCALKVKLQTQFSYHDIVWQVLGHNLPGHVPPRHLPQGHYTPRHLPPGHLPPRTLTLFLFPFYFLDHILMRKLQNRIEKKGHGVTVNIMANKEYYRFCQPSFLYSYINFAMT